MIMRNSIRMLSSFVIGLILCGAVCAVNLVGGRQAAAARRNPQDLSYNYGYVLSYPPAPSPQAMLRMAVSHFSAYFPFQGCGQVLKVGQVCNLIGPNGNNPIRVVAIGPTSFTFLSLPGHFEGPNRTIVFSFIEQLQPIATHRLFLNVHASGPSSPGAVTSVATGQAHGTWQDYATNLQRGIASGAAR
jgi:hypothetical protein